MKLREALEKYPAERVIYVCAKTAAIVGCKKDQVENALRKKDSQTIEKKQQELGVWYALLEQAVSCGDQEKEDKAAKKCESLNEEISGYIPLMERVVIEEYDRTCEDATNILIEGEEVGRIWSIDKSKTELNYNTEGLVAAIIKQVANNYEDAFSLELREFRRLLDNLERYRENSKQWEKWFRSSEYAKFTSVSPEYLINTIRRITIEKLGGKR